MANIKAYMHICACTRERERERAFPRPRECTLSRTRARIHLRIRTSVHADMCKEIETGPEEISVVIVCRYRNFQNGSQLLVEDLRIKGCEVCGEGDLTCGDSDREQTMIVPRIET
eukprot:COSAG05_NODE_4170_length_1642_cov_1.197019_3_plen_115_part_00